MQIEPDFAAFERNYGEARAQALFVRRIADLETPVSAYLKLAQSRDNTFLLESVQGGETRGRYSVIGIEPDLVWRCRNGRAETVPDNHETPELAERPLQSLRRLVSGIRMEMPSGLALPRRIRWTFPTRSCCVRPLPRCSTTSATKF